GPTDGGGVEPEPDLAAAVPGCAKYRAPALTRSRMAVLPVTGALPDGPTNAVQMSLNAFELTPGSNSLAWDTASRVTWPAGAGRVNGPLWPTSAIHRPGETCFALTFTVAPLPTAAAYTSGSPEL